MTAILDSTALENIVVRQEAKTPAFKRHHQLLAPRHITGTPSLKVPTHTTLLLASLWPHMSCSFYQQTVPTHHIHLENSSLSQIRLPVVPSEKCQDAPKHQGRKSLPNSVCWEHFFCRKDLCQHQPVDREF